MKIMITERQYKFIAEQKPDSIIDRQSNAIMNATGIRPDKEYQEVNRMLDNSLVNDKSLPLHWRMAIRFLFKSKTPMTNSDLSSNHISILQNVLCVKSKLQKTCDTNKWTGVNKEKITNRNQLLYDDFTIKYPKSPNYGSTTFSFDAQPDGVRELMLSLGNSTVKLSGGNWVITDEYDFKNIMKTKPYLKTKSFFGILKNRAIGLFKVLLSLVTSRSAPDGMEEMLSQHHNTGYNGFNTKLIIPVGNCSCKTLK